MSLAIRTGLLSIGAALCLAAPLPAQNDLDQGVNKEADSLLATYKHLHQNPELSRKSEDRTRS